MRARAALGLAISVLGLGVPAAAASASTVHPFLGSITGERIVQGAQFKGACGVTVDSQNYLYLADYYHDEIDVFSPSREFLTRIPAINPLDPSGAKPLNGPCDLAVDSTGSLYVNNYHGDVLRFEPSSFPPTKTTTYGPAVTIDSGSATGIAVDPVSDDLYVDDRGSVAVHEAPVVPEAEPQRIGLGSLVDGYGVAVSAGRVLVADAAAGALKVYEPSVDPADPVLTISGDGTPGGGFGSLVDGEVAIDPVDGHLYVVDNLRPDSERPEAVVHEFSSLGHYRGQVPSPVSEGESSFLRSAEPSGLAIGPNRTIYVTSGNYEGSVVFLFGPAPFAPTELLSVAKTGAGAGTIVSSPPGLRCGGVCTGEFEQVSNVTLRAVPARGSRLAGWIGCGSNPSPSSCQVSMAASRSVTAEFQPVPQRTLTVAVAGAGRGTVRSDPTGIACGSVCEGEFDQGSTVTLTAEASDGSRLAAWSGCDSVPAPGSCDVTMGASRSVAAEFEALPDEEAPVPGPAISFAEPEWLAPAPDPPPLRVRAASRRGRVATLRAWVPGPGELVATGRGLRRSSALAFDAGPQRLRLRLDRQGSRNLAASRNRRLVLRVRVTFLSFSDLPPASKSLKVVLTAKRGGR